MKVPQIPQLVTELEITEGAPKTSKLYAFLSAKWRPILSEFLSTLMLTLLGCMTYIPVEGYDTSLYPPFGFGFAVLLNIQIFGHISGAYMNPAVTLASVIWGNISIALGIIYVIAECAGAVLGYGILMALSPIDLATEGVCVSGLYAYGLTELQALGIEAVITAALSFICCGLWDPLNANKQDSMPIKFGLVIAGLMIVAGPLTGAGMNPAVSLGPSVWTGHWDQHWIYWVGPLVGSGAAAVFYKYIFLKKSDID